MYKRAQIQKIKALIGKEYLFIIGFKMLPASSAISNIREEAVEDCTDSHRTSIKTPRTNRIFNQASPPRETAHSPQKMMASQTTRLHSTRYVSPDSCHIYYKQDYCSPRQRVASVSPQKLTLIKSNQTLQYEITLLLKQLQQRDDVIKMYRNGYSPSSTPINDSLIKSLNLQLTQKHVLIEQLHRNLLQFLQQSKKQSVQVSPFCLSKIMILLKLIQEHDHYPVIIRERLLQGTKVYVTDESFGNLEGMFDRSCNQLMAVKDKLGWFQTQNQVLDSTIAGLKVHKDSCPQQDINYYKSEIHRLTTQLISLQTHQKNNKSQIQTLTQTVNLLNKSLLKTPPVPDNTQNTQTSRLRQQIKKYQKRVVELSEKDRQIVELKQVLEKLQGQVVAFRGREARILGENGELRGVVEDLRGKLEDRGQGARKIQDMVRGFEMRIDAVEKELEMSSLKIRQLIGQNKICSDEATKWRKHLQQAQDYIEQLLKQLETLKKPHPIPTPPSPTVTLQLTSLQTQIKSLQKQCQTLKQQQQSSQKQSEQYRLQINEYSKKIEILMRQRENQVKKWEEILSRKDMEYQANLEDMEKRMGKEDGQWEKQRQEYQGVIEKMRKEIGGYLQQINQLKSSKSRADWEQEIVAIRQQYETKLKQLWMKLTISQDYIYQLQQSQTLQIQSLKANLSKAETLNKTLQQSSTKQKDEYRYRIDTKYGQICKKLLQLSHKNTESISLQAQFWEQYRRQRQQELEDVSKIISEILAIIGNVDQTLIIRREELYRLDFAKLEEVLIQINKLKQSKAEINRQAKTKIQTKFYGLLKTAATQFLQ